MKINTLSIIIPVFNEEKTVQTLLDKVVEVDLIKEIRKELIVINDCSVDNTDAIISKYIENHPEINIQYIKHSKNTGKGGALHSGIKHATGEYLVIQDADLEYDPKEYNILLEPIVNGLADVVFGSRFLTGKAHRVLYFWHSVGNKFLTLLSNMFSNLNLTDMETCYKLFDTKMIQSIKLQESRFGFEPEVTIKISRIPNIRIYEVGISYFGRSYSEGKKINWKDGVRAIYCILRYGLFK
jgi:glycosyltransferase involved in cell wall biosynthesis